jgi:hypothetical protein
MSHRLALALSIALTLVLAAGIFAGRDRLFEAAADAGPSTVTPAPAVSLDDAVSGSERAVSGAAPRVIEIPLPSNEQRSSLHQGDNDSQVARSRDDEQERIWDDDEQEGEDDD